MAKGRMITVILPSFRDRRILSAIDSIRRFDDIKTVSILVIDGGSDMALIADIRSALSENDVLVAEPDKGIFDALNKGLSMVVTDYIGWLGSDDLYSNQIKASDVIEALRENDLFVASLAVVNDVHIKRVTHSYPCSIGLAKWGLHNPHYATFGRSDLLKAERFEISEIGADIGYFLKLFSRHPRVAWTDKIGVLMREGGYSNSSANKIIQVNRTLLKFYKYFNGPIGGYISISIKISYKILGNLYYSIVKSKWSNLYYRQ
jgi:glycosyltransferase involved in cell wall biosynthesis